MEEGPRDVQSYKGKKWSEGEGDREREREATERDGMLRK